MPDYYSIGEFSKKTGVTVRTLHYYDEIGLLKPAVVTNSGRRKYSKENLVTLQKIITLKYLGFPLEKIKELLSRNHSNLKESFALQKQLLLEQKKKMEEAIAALDRALEVTGEEEDIDADILIYLIHSFHTEEQQKELLKKAFGTPKVEELFAISTEKRLELEKKVVQILHKVKKLYPRPPEDPETRQLVEEYLNIARGLIHEAAFQELAGKEIHLDEEEFLWYFAYPLTEEEDQWFFGAVERYLKGKGVDLFADGKDEDP